VQIMLVLVHRQEDERHRKAELLLLLHNRHIFPFHYSFPQKPSSLYIWS
jgi:hypothetical protein